MDVPLTDRPTGRRCSGWDRDGIVVDLPRLGETRVGLRGRHQAANVAVADATLDALEAAGIADAPADARRRGYATARWPGRLELIDVDGRRGRREVLLDGAHNPAGAAALAGALDDLRPYLAGGTEAAPPALTLVVGVMARQGRRRRRGGPRRRLVAARRAYHLHPPGRAAGDGAGRPRRAAGSGSLRAPAPSPSRTWTEPSSEPWRPPTGRSSWPDRSTWWAPSGRAWSTIRSSSTRIRRARSRPPRPDQPGDDRMNPAERDRLAEPDCPGAGIVPARPDLGGGAASPSFARPRALRPGWPAIRARRRSGRPPSAGARGPS